MEEKPYKWLLQEICNNRIFMKILETGICRGTKLIAWYCNTSTDTIICKSSKSVSKTRYLINYFLNSRVPILEEYAPEKLICYLYHKTGKKIVTAKEAIELAENQLHGLQVTSIHMAIISSIETYSLSAINVGGELNTEIVIGKFGKNANQIVKDPIIIEKVINLLVYINDTVVKLCKQQIQEIQIDLLFDPKGYPQIIKIEKLLVNIEIRSSIGKKSSIKLIQFDDSSDENLENEISPIHTKGAIGYILEKEKRNHAIKVPIAKPFIENSSNFLQMIANTFDRDRKRYTREEYKKNSKNSVPLPEKNELLDDVLQLNARKSFRDRSLKKSLNSLNDLLSYVEKTRPKI